MKSKNAETLVQGKEDLCDLPEDIPERILEFREEMSSGLDDPEDMVTESSGVRFH